MTDNSEKFGSDVPFAEPSWYNAANPNPYYGEQHIKFRAAMREFVDNEITPNVEEWEDAGEVPAEVYGRAAQVGLLASMCNWPSDLVPGLPPRPEGFDQFYTLIAADELCRCASGGVVWGMIGGFGIGIPPIIHYGSEELKERVAKPCILGTKRIALAVSEPYAGSDVGGIRTTAVDMGDHYVVNGIKKWITCGMYADFFTVAARTGDAGTFRHFPPRLF
jgi:alkylation response protein AidB-like acyl-CoA dehydrogenase